MIMGLELAETNVVTKLRLFPPGTRLVSGPCPYRYARAGADLKAGQAAFAHFEGELKRDANGNVLWDEDQAEAIWSDMRPDGAASEFRGWPTVNVPFDFFFWVMEA